MTKNMQISLVAKALGQIFFLFVDLRDSFFRFRVGGRKTKKL